jgi:hypothetical protein
LAAWHAATRAIDEVNGSNRTWADVSTTLHDATADAAIEATGGHRVIADRTNLNTRNLQTRFREAYEQELRS